LRPHIFEVCRPNIDLLDCHMYAGKSGVIPKGIIY
jgi:hypothetical protein